jgi:small subunit ribosomal protein S14
MNRHRVVKDKIRRAYVDEDRVRRACLKALSVGGGREESLRVSAGLALGKMRRDGSAVRVVNRCVVSGFARSNRLFGYSRFVMRDKCRCGSVPGVKKASW